MNPKFRAVIRAAIGKMAAVLLRLRAAWRRRSNFTRHFLVNCLIGLGIEAVLHASHHASWLEAAHQASMDWMMRMHRSVAIDQLTHKLPFVLIDIDRRTYRSIDWGGGEPLYTPRDRLAQLVKYALESGASYVVVDIAIDGRLGAEEDALAAELAPLLDQRKSSAHLLLVRTFQDRSDMGMLLQRMRNGIDDRPPLAGLSNVHSVAPLFRVSADRVLRQWLLWQVACALDANGEALRWRIIPSVQLQVLQLESDWGKRPPWLDHSQLQLSSAAEATLAKSCGTDPPAQDEQRQAIDEVDLRLRAWLATEPSPHIDGAEHAVGHAADPVSSRIVFTLPWSAGSAEAIPMPHVPHPRREGEDVPLLRVVPAWRVIDSPPPFDLGGSLVLIGASYEESHDLAYTPIGFMPGSTVVINSIHSLLSLGIVHPPSQTLTWMIALLLILMVASVTAAIHSILGIVLALALVLVALVPLSLHYFSQGLWLDFAVPSIGVLLHRLVETLRDWYREVIGEDSHDAH